MKKPQLRFAKIAATPSETAWAQAYSAGSLFAVLSITREEEGEDHIALNSHGKILINNIETEFFTLEEKSLASIKKALGNALDDIPSSLAVSLALLYVKDSILYVFLTGSGKISMRRNGQTGTLLAENETDANKDTSRHIKTASGMLKPGDRILAETAQFINIVPKEAVAKALDEENPQEAAEILTPLVHEKDAGSAAAIILSYALTDAASDQEEQVVAEAEIELEPEPPHDDSPERTEIRQEIQPEDHPAKPEPTLQGKETDERPHASHIAGLLRFLPSFRRHLNHKRKVFLSVAVILLLVLVTSIYLTTQNKEREQTRALFNEVYGKAEQEYQEGEGLAGLNKNLAHDDFLAAQAILEENINKFKEGTEERQKLEELLTKIETQLQDAGGVTEVVAKEVELTDAPLLGFAKEQTEAKYVAEDENNLYALNNDGVIIADKTGATKETIENDDLWNTPGGLGAYNGNLYVLDKEDGIVKLVGSGSEYSDTAYFTTEKPDLSTAKAIAIDGAIWILFADGTISKYTRGVKDAFSVNGLDTPFNKPARIITGVDMEAVYILDNGNSRIVKLNKDGSYEAQYVTIFAKNAKDFSVNETAKKAYLFSNNKLYEIAL